MKNNRLCELLDIRYPIVQAPMNWITGADLAAAVSNAGGLGTLGPNAGARTVTADVGETGERLRRQIQKVKSLTDKPFAVNFPIGMEGMEGEGGRKFSQRCVEVALEEGIPVAITSVGAPNVYTNVLKDAGIKVLHAVSTAGHAKKAEEKGVDAVICEGYEGGGHKATTELTTMTMIPMAAEMVKIPVIAAGGIADARGMVAAFALGADGVYVGTRFIATHECDAHPKVKEAVIMGSDVCTVSVKKWIVAARDLKNAFTQKFTEMQEGGAPMEEILQFMQTHTMYNALVEGDTDEGELPCGQNAGIIHGLKHAAEVIENMVAEASQVMDGLKQKLPTA
ncbi:MAG: enoyl-[acyl-carrier-protein] reductase FabK [Deltaproteobacteria bacterium]|nr:enoyl-[acyl-carrier-protein] reductase FabK [Deltaproteobacteria bacterium]